MNTERRRDAWKRVQVLLLAAAAVAVAGSAGQGGPGVALLLAGTLALAVVACFHRLVPLATVSTPTGARLRAWTAQEAMIWRAEEPDRAGRARPRAPGAAESAP